MFRIWFIPFDSAPVQLTSVLQLTTENPEASFKSNGKKYWIATQDDRYQSDQFTLFISPYRIGYTLVLLFQYWATLMCVLGSIIGYPLTWYLDNVDVHARAKQIDHKKQA